MACMGGTPPRLACRPATAWARPLLHMLPIPYPYPVLPLAPHLPMCPPALQKNHLSGLKRRLLKVTTFTVQGLMEVRHAQPRPPGPQGGGGLVAGREGRRGMAGWAGRHAGKGCAVCCRPVLFNPSMRQGWEDSLPVLWQPPALAPPPPPPRSAAIAFPAVPAPAALAPRPPPRLTNSSPRPVVPRPAGPRFGAR